MHTRCSCIRSCIIPYRLASPQGFGKPLLILPVAKGRNQRVQHNHKAQAGGGSGQSEAPSPSPSSPPPQQAQQPFGQLLALAAVGVGAAAFILSRFSSGAPNLSSLEKTAVPFDTALANGKPSLLEFYANWCETCRESAPDVYKVTLNSSCLPVRTCHVWVQSPTLSWLHLDIYPLLRHICLVCKFSQLCKACDVNCIAQPCKLAYGSSCRQNGLSKTRSTWSC